MNSESSKAESREKRKEREKELFISPQITKNGTRGKAKRTRVEREKKGVWEGVRTR